MFRDPHVAAAEKEIARLKDELAVAKANDQELLDRLEAAETDLEIERAKGGRIKRWFDERARRKEAKADRESKPFLPRRGGFFNRPYRPFYRRITLFHLMAAIIGVFITGVIGLNIYHYFTDLQEGVVTGTEYHPEETHCSTDDEGNVDCTTYPEHWTVDIAYEGQTATWTIPENEYNQVHRGDWYCFTDIMHDAENCHGPEN